MLIKRITGATLAEAVERTRAACGEDALLVETRRTRDGYVIVAARPATPPAARSTAGHHAAPPAWTRGFAEVAARGQAFGLSDALLQTVEKTMIGTRVALGRAGDPAVPGVAARILGAMIKTAALDLPDCRVAALVGPTGVGKTTTLAKLAAAAVRTHGESIAILTIDTYRIAAVEQLRAFADMLAVPFEVAFTPQDLRRAIARHTAADRILIDTSGRSPHDRRALQALCGLLAPARPTGVLCLPVSARRTDAIAAAEAFRPLEIRRAVLTKWDETSVPGEALSVAVERGLPLSHVTVGQEVPDDIVDAEAAALAAAALLEPAEMAS